MADAGWVKDPDATLDWAWDWSNWLAPSEVITSSLFILSPGITQVSASNTGSSATIWLSGGSPGQPYSVTNRVTTNQGRTDDRSITIRVKDR